MQLNSYNGLYIQSRPPSWQYQDQSGTRRKREKVCLWGGGEVVCGLHATNNLFLSNTHFVCPPPAPPHTLLLKWTTAQSFSINLRGSLCFAQSYNIHSFLKDFVITMLGSEQGWMNSSVLWFVCFLNLNHKAKNQFKKNPTIWWWFCDLPACDSNET